MAERPRDQDFLPIGLAVDYVLVVGAHRPKLQEGEPHRLSEVLLARRSKVDFQTDVVTMEREGVVGPALPDPCVAIC